VDSEHALNATASPMLKAFLPQPVRHRMAADLKTLRVEIAHLAGTFAMNSGR
jgi:hypothetical protein